MSRKRSWHDVSVLAARQHLDICRRLHSHRLAELVRDADVLPGWRWRAEVAAVLLMVRKMQKEKLSREQREWMVNEYVRLGAEVGCISEIEADVITRIFTD